MVYKPLAVRVALVVGFRRALPVFRSMIVVAVAVVMWESPQGFPRGVGGVESRLFGFPCFPYPGISTVFVLGLNVSKQTAPGFRTTIILLWERDAGFS
jgi:membrane protease YdiL (CAAX protease family)